MGGAGRRHARSHALGLERPVPSDAEPVAVLDVRNGAVEHGAADADAHPVARADDGPAPPAGLAGPAADDPAGPAGAATDRRTATTGTADGNRTGTAEAKAHDPAGAVQPPAGAPPDLGRRFDHAHSEDGTGDTTATDAVHGTPALTGLPGTHAPTSASALATVRHARTTAEARHTRTTTAAHRTRTSAEVRDAEALGVIRPPGAGTDTGDAAGALEARTDAVRQDAQADADDRWRRTDDHHVVHLPGRDGRRPPHGERRRGR
ncbi:hypothetical protein ACH5A7_29315 [Streptomyces sp. NPDC018955]|uniref:hypothetical protein n=1 Tax=Streptomyces sp. NPDC018955 TaxID=3365055 RepID=UPI0037AC0C71